jgi:hypothetical protein
MRPPERQQEAAVRLEITHGEMNTAIDQGDALPLGHGLGWVMRYQGSWWVDCEQGWFRVTDEATVLDLDQVAGRLAEAQGVACQDAADRLGAGRGPGAPQAPGGSRDNGGANRPALGSRSGDRRGEEA